MKNLSREDLVLAANTIRCLSADGVQKAKSGHPGMPMGMADVAAVLWLKHFEHCPANPAYPSRDRFVLSGGHGSMLLYSLLHLAGYDLPLDELKKFRQWGSKTPGHPEFGHTPGVETTTGPLGQGCANAVGMAIAERMLAQRFNTEDYQPVDHYTYVFCGDGDLMEGISHEAFALAGHLGLHKLIVFYDSNKITIEGSTDLAYSDDVRRRFQGYNWKVLEIDAHDYEQIDKAIRSAQRECHRPTIIICKSHIAHGSPNKHDTAGAHGEPLGDDEVKATKKNLGFPEDREFYVPDRVAELFQTRKGELKRKAAKWDRDFNKYCEANPDKATLWRKHFTDAIPEDLEKSLPVFDVSKPLATRVASEKVIQAMAQAVPWLVGGSADLAPSTKTLIAGAESIARGKFAGRNFHFGVREHGMAGVLNGIALHGGFRVYGATFFVFSDYCRPSVRLSAMMKVPVIYVFTHDSFYVGEDGPTHEPVEHTMALRTIPGITVIRPSDPTETGAAWVTALKNRKGPTALLLTRHNLSVIDRSKYAAASNLEKGAYTLWQSAGGDPELILIATGSEVEVALKAAEELAKTSRVRVVSMPSWELFDKQTEEYRNSVLPPSCKRRLSVEAGITAGWGKYVGDQGKSIGLDRFGASGPYKVLAENFGFTAANVVAVARTLK